MLKNESQSLSTASTEEKPKGTVLIVDDSPFALKMLQRQVAKFDYDVITAHSGDDALAALEKTRIDVLLTDINMPGITGIELYKHALEQHPNLHCIFITGNTEVETAIAALTVGADYYLIKPIDARELNHALTIVFKRINLVHLVEDKQAELMEANDKLKAEIIQHKKLEGSLAQSKANFASIVEFNMSGMLVVDCDDTVIYSNRAAVSFFSADGKSLVGRKFEIPQQNGNRQEVGIIRLDGTSGTASALIEEITWLRKDARLYVFMDITAQKTTEENEKHYEVKLRQAQKLESIGQLAAGIAHEINTPTQFVADNNRFLKESIEDLARILEVYDRLVVSTKEAKGSEELLAEIETIKEDIDLAYLRDEIPAAIAQSLEGIKRISEIVQSMKEFSHPGGKDKCLVDINKSLLSTITVARNEWKYVSTLETELDSYLPAVPCFAGEFNQVILNMIINAVHAIETGRGDDTETLGRIDITTTHTDNHVEIAIKDSGTGIPPDVQAHIFDPFFTTKDIGKGTGQGLALAWDVIVNKHSGEILCESVVGEGTTFRIRLPLDSE
jgi:two-component system, NtrC family, sensor kinase